MKIYGPRPPSLFHKWPCIIAPIHYIVDQNWDLITEYFFGKFKKQKIMLLRLHHETSWK
jgi:hypothetical protein